MKKVVRMAAGIMAASLLVGCGAEGNDESSEELESVTLGTLPVLPTAVVILGDEQGFFEAEGIALEMQSGQGGAALIPAVVTEEQDFATGDVVALFNARDRGLEVQALTSFTYDTDEGVHALLVHPDSGINEAADLEGRSIAINVLQSMGQVLVTEALEVNGVDPSTVEFLEIPFPDMPAALEEGRVDAVWTPEPFMTLLENSNAIPLLYPGVEAVQGHPTMVVFTSTDLMENRPEVGEAMQRAMHASMDYATENADEVRATAVEHLEIDEELAQQVVLEDFGGELRVDQIEEMGRLMVEHGFLEEDADVDGLLGEAVN